MDSLKSFNHIILVSVVISTVQVVYGQVTPPCTTTMINSVSPCLNFITQGNVNMSTPSPACCSSLQSLTGASMDCACLFVSGNVPFQLPINRTLVVSLPRACNMASVPMQCKASAPVAAPAPAPVSFGASPSPSTTPSVPQPTSSAQAPESDTPSALTPTSPTGTGTSGVRPVLTPNSAPKLSTISLPSILLLVAGVLVLKH